MRRKAEEMPQRCQICGSLKELRKDFRDFEHKNIAWFCNLCREYLEEAEKWKIVERETGRLSDNAMADKKVIGIFDDPNETFWIFFSDHTVLLFTANFDVRTHEPEMIVGREGLSETRNRDEVAFALQKAKIVLNK